MASFIKLSCLIFTLLNSGFSEVVIKKEGDTFTTTYNKNVNLKCDLFQWFRHDKSIQRCFLDSADFATIFTCKQAAFTRDSEATLSSNYDFITTNLTVKNVFRSINDSDEGVWTFDCTVPNVTALTTIDLKLYATPTNPQCRTVFHTNGLIVSCSVDRIYPQANFYVQINNTLKNQSACTNISNSSILYYNSVCNFAYPISSILIGNLEINMTVYPNLTSSVNDSKFGISSFQTVNIQFPSSMSNNCPQKDIIEGFQYNCKCERKDVSDIPTMISWFINGTENVSSSNSVSVLSFNASRYNTNYTCLAVNVFNWTSNPVTYQPNVQYSADVISLLINNSTNNAQVVNNATTLMIDCQAMGNPEPTLSLTKDGSKLISQAKSNFSLIFNYKVSCNDTGTYSCSAQNGIGDISWKTTEVFVKCPLQLKDPSTNESVLLATVRNDVSVTISVFGYPKPVMYELIKSGVKKLIVNESKPQTNVSTKFALAYQSTSLSNGDVTLTIYNISTEDFANYSLVICNSEEGNLTYSLRIENGKRNSVPQVNDDLNWEAIGGGLGASILIILIALIVYNAVTKRSQKVKDDMVVILNEDIYWTELSQNGFLTDGIQVQAKVFNMDYVSPITSACAPPGNYENFCKRK